MMPIPRRLSVVALFVILLLTVRIVSVASIVCTVLFPDRSDPRPTSAVYSSLLPDVGRGSMGPSRQLLRQTVASH